MASEVIKLNLIPKGEMPVFHASQFDTGRLITCELYRGEDAYSVPEGYTVELHCRKIDNNIVTMASTLINDNVVTFTSTEQLTACNGKNLCEVAILDEGYRIGTLNFILEVEIDPLKGGITSTSEIHNLETQVEEITTEIIGENYYDKSEVDDLLSAKADSDSVYTIGEVNTLLSGKANTADVYTKSQTDTLLSAKANSSDVYTKGQVDTALSAKADTTYVDTEVDDLETAISAKADASSVYTKSQVDSALALKANAADVYTKTQTDTALATKADKSDTYTKEQVDTLIDNIFPTLTVSGAIATFTTALSKPLVSVTADVSATTVTACGVNLFQTTATSKSEAGVDWIVNDDGTINVLGTATGYTSLEVGTAKVNNRMGVVTISGIASATNIAWDVVELRDIDNNTLYTVTSGSVDTSFTVDLTSYPDVDNIRISLKRYTNSAVSGVIKPQVELGNEVTTYHPYNGQTVPVSDATTLVTQSGVNNVYANVGNVTVQYKYMSM